MWGAVKRREQMSIATSGQGAAQLFHLYAGSREDMAFRDFRFPQVLQELGLTTGDADLFASAPAFPVGREIAAFVQYGVALAAANSTEKAKSEFIIAPVLVELRR